VSRRPLTPGPDSVRKRQTSDARVPSEPGERDAPRSPPSSRITWPRTPPDGRSAAGIDPSARPHRSGGALAAHAAVAVPPADAGEVDERGEDGAREPDLAVRIIAPLDGYARDAEPECARDRQDLDVERPAVDTRAREDGPAGVGGECLEAAREVGDGAIDQPRGQEREALAEELAQAALRRDDLRPRPPPAADDDVGAPERV